MKMLVLVPVKDLLVTKATQDFSVRTVNRAKN